MKTNLILLQRSSYDLSKEILWNEHRQRGYVIRDPANTDELLYLTNSEYMKLLRVMLSNESLIEVIATPRDTPDSINRKYPDPTDKTPKRAVLKEFLFNTNPNWRVKDSMIDIRGNPDTFLLIYYKHIISWLNLKPSKLITRSYRKLAKSFSLIIKANGMATAILRMKISTIVVLKYLAGEKVTSTQDLGMRIRLRAGLPATLPYPLRLIIRQKSVPLTRVLITVLYSYKGFVSDYKTPSLATVVAPKAIFSPKTLLRLGQAADLFFKDIISKHTIKYIRPIPDVLTVPMTLTSGPNSTISFLGAGLDALLHFALDDRSSLVRYIRLLVELNPDRDKYPYKALYWLEQMMWQTGALAEDKGFFIPTDPKLHGVSPPKFKLPAYITKILDFKPSFEAIDRLKLGKLSFKYEAAGQVRVFAIVDYFTQWFMKPIHDSLFDILRVLPGDATFDQLGKVKAFQEKGYTYIASFDLKAATDLIPQQLYLAVLEPFFGPNGKRLVKAWLDVLVDREYVTEVPYKYKYSPSSETRIVKYTNPKLISKIRFFVRYTRGQPMGALSSWASMALVHHFLVYVAAMRINRPNFQDYLILGDDIVIADRNVADSYKVVCHNYGITIGLPKSFISEIGMFQFASQDVVSVTNYSPISLKEVMSIDMQDTRFFRQKGITTLSARVEFVNRLVWKGFISPANPINLVRACYSYHDWRVIRRSLSRGVLPPLLGPALLLLMSSPLRFADKSVNLVQIMSLLKGDIYGTINGRDFPLFERIEFLEALYDSLDKEFQKEFHRILLELRSMSADTFIMLTPSSALFGEVCVSKREKAHKALIRVSHEWVAIRDEAYGIIRTLELQHLLWEMMTDGTDLNIKLVQSYIRIVRDLSAISTEVDIISQVSRPKSVKELRDVRLYASLASSWNKPGRTIPGMG
jgi:hypothetical protein